MDVNNIVTVVFDIDRVLGFGTVKDVRQAIYYDHWGNIVKVPKAYYLFHGVPELIQLMKKTEGVETAFFSANLKERNQLLVKEVFRLAFPEQQQETGKEVKVGSDTEMKRTSEEAKKNCQKDYGVGLGYKHKDIKLVLREGAQVENALLWDDCIGCAAPDQIKNCLVVPVANYDSFAYLEEKIPLYNEGVRSIGWEFASVSNEGYLQDGQKNVSRRTRLLVVKDKTTFEIHFLEKQSKEYKKQQLTEEKDSELIAALNQFCERLNSQSSDGTSINDEELMDKLNCYVDACGGIRKKICRQLNRLCYAVGLFFTALEKAKTEKLSPSEALFQLQYEKQGERYVSKVKQLKTRDELYILGYEKLKTVNPEFKLLTMQDYYHSFKQASQEKWDELEKIMREI